MFNDFDKDSKEESVPNQAKKKRQEYVEMKPDFVHSSLDYHTIKVPPMVEYKSIESYCEKKGHNFLTGSNMTSVKSISSPVVLRTPQPRAPDTALPSSEGLPFCFFSVEELSLLKVLDNWTNLKVCPVGKLSYTSRTSECYLNSVGENGSWKILLDVSNLKANHASHKLLQVYGILHIYRGKPIINVFFVSNLGTCDLPLLVESYKLMQPHIPKSIKLLNSDKVGEMKTSEEGEDAAGHTMMDIVELPTVADSFD